ncbi:MAG: Flp family type IVb pilin [Cohaesibacteraceae bacterium]|nr:Flp family type IVb pilin [Cohaesibacteraceae bacterium]
MLDLIVKFSRQEDASVAIEYCLVASLIGVAILSGAAAIGEAVSGLLATANAAASS